MSEPKDDNTMYEKVCKDRFDTLERKIDGLSDRLFKNNGKRALVTCIEDNKEATKRLAEQLADHLTEVPAPAKTQRIFKVGKDGLEAEGYTGRDLVKIILGIAILLYMFGRDYGPALLKKVLSDTPPAEVANE